MTAVLWWGFLGFGIQFWPSTKIPLNVGIQYVLIERVKEKERGHSLGIRRCLANRYHLPSKIIFLKGLSASSVKKENTQKFVLSDSFSYVVR